jgi:hypothetical protein
MLSTSYYVTYLHCFGNCSNDRCVSKNIFIGVMSSQAALDNYVGSDAYGWGYLANKAIWHNKGKVSAFSDTNTTCSALHTSRL